MVDYFPSKQGTLGSIKKKKKSHPYNDPQIKKICKPLSVAELRLTAARSSSNPDTDGRVNNA